ncbi:gag-pol polyprotein [Chaetoceros tenuissimus]|uniref:Gag-pol polyprotein n=1 Tax=Chaetoceros tenuissimus TaxID=426638 RepID=A0AAD3H3X5_9STRA|nr:gag-pol polyprotein [Chaetoceros tenuissimus]
MDWRHSLEILATPSLPTKEKCFIKCGPEFGDRHGCITLIVKALYGLRTSAEHFHSLLADFLRGLGFTPSKFDRDVWLCRRIGGKKSDLDVQNDGYDYICTHVNNFKIVAQKPEHLLKKIQEYFLVKEHGPLKYYLGNDFSYCARRSHFF